jgi:excisionase family DNA binding protein
MGNQQQTIPRDPTAPSRPQAPETLEAAQNQALMTPQEAAQYLRISVATLQRLSRFGEIPGIHIGKLWRYKKSDLDEWLASKVSSFRHPCRK